MVMRQNSKSSRLVCQGAHAQSAVLGRLLEEEGLGKPLAGMGKWKGMGPGFPPRPPELSSWSFLEE